MQVLSLSLRAPFSQPECIHSPPRTWVPYNQAGPNPTGAGRPPTSSIPTAPLSPDAETPYPYALYAEDLANAYILPRATDMPVPPDQMFAHPYSYPSPTSPSQRSGSLDVPPLGHSGPSI